MLGKTVKDKITGFTGVVTGTAKYLTGCDQACVTPKADDPSKYPDGVWMDVNRLTIKKAKAVSIDTTNDKGAMSPPCTY